MNDRVTTLDLIHVALERLGYTGQTFRAVLEPGTAYAIYRAGDSSVMVRSARGATLYELEVSPAPAADTVRAELAQAALVCRAEGTRIDVFGQEHIDAEVRRMLAPD